MILALSTSSALLVGLLAVGVTFLGIAVVALRLEWTLQRRLRLEAHITADSLKRVFARGFGELGFEHASDRVEDLYRNLSSGTPRELSEAAGLAGTFLDGIALDLESIDMAHGNVMLMPVGSLAFIDPGTDADLAKLVAFQRAVSRLQRRIAHVTRR